MYPRGTIYQRGISRMRGVVYLHAPFKIKALYSLLRGLGVGLIGFAVITILFSFAPIIKEEISYKIGLNQAQGAQGFAKLIDLAQADRTSKIQEEAKSLGLNSYFSIFIPKINARAQVIANVDAADEEQYSKALSEGVAHAAGTYFPGQGKSIFLFSHSTDAPWNIAKYNAVFYLLRELDAGDKIIIYFADHRYEYVVEKKVITKPTDTSWLTGNSDAERLVLQTCDPPGTSLNRLLVIAKPSY